MSTTRYETIGSSLALADLRAGHSPEDGVPADITAAAGLHEGGAEYRAIFAGEVVGYEGIAGVARAQVECVRGYLAEIG